MTSTPVLRFDHVAYSYGRRAPALDGVSFHMNAGDVVALLGVKGAGKTTLLQLAMGMRVPDRGTVRMFGLSPVAEPVAVKRRVGYVPAEPVFPARLTVGEVIAVHRRVFPTWDHALERQLLDQFGLACRRNRLTPLSRDEARQLALLCAACHRPELFLLDEPASGLDPVARSQLLKTSIQLLYREGTAILLSSHFMFDVERLGARVVVLHGGRVALDESADELHDEYCVAVFARHGVADDVPDAIRQLPGCLHVRPMLGEWHAVFRGEPDTVLQRLCAVGDLPDLYCVRVPPEELLVDLLGDEQLVAVP